MGLLDSIAAWFKKETADVKEAVSGVTRDLDVNLSRKERDLDASPEERMDLIQEEIQDSDRSLDAIRDRIEGTAAHAEALEELATDPPADG